MILLALALGAAAPRYDEASRIAYVRAALGVVSEASPTVLQQTYDFVSQMERNSCNAQYDRLRVECLMAASRRWCKDKKRKLADPAACVLWSDTVVTVALSEKQLVPASQRYEIMKKHADYRAEMRRTVRRLQGASVVAYRLAEGRGCAGDDLDCLARTIDAYCRASADVYNVAWQSCAASLVWFIGTAR